MIEQRHAKALIAHIGRSRSLTEQERSDALEAIDMLDAIASGNRRALTQDQSKILFELFDYMTFVGTDHGGITVGEILGRMLTEKGMGDEAMNSERMEIYLTLSDMSGEDL